MIYKYQVPMMPGRYPINVGWFATFTSASPIHRDKGIELWTMRDSARPDEIRKRHGTQRYDAIIHVKFTGEDTPGHSYHIDTFKVDGFVFHVFAEERKHTESL